ncbi:MAG TPA: MBL fold metallo-hydrolase [Terriglobales bacterium]
MVRLTVLASGSKGNSAVISSSAGSILVDAGLSCRETLRRMHAAGEDPHALKAIVITHEHQDHVNGLPVLARKLKAPIYMTPATHDAWAQWVRGAAGKQSAMFPEDDKAHIDCLEHFHSGQSFQIGGIAVLPFTIPHDAADPVGFVFQIDGVRVGVVTDLGYMPSNVRMHLRGCDVLMVESNHDLEMLRGGPYPWSVKQRVMSRVGHLSNEALAEFFSKDYDGGAAFVILAHLSECNNHPELARGMAERALGPRGNLLGNRVLLALQSAPTESICL